MKVCSTCNESKLLTEFSKHSTTRDGLSSNCKKCRSKSSSKSKLKRFGSWSNAYNSRIDYFIQYYKNNVVEIAKKKAARYYSARDGMCYVYYRSEGNYIGKTITLKYRERYHSNEITPQAMFKNESDALIVEAILQHDYGFSGWHSKQSKTHYNKAKQSHKRLAKQISQRIFTCSIKIKVMSNYKRFNREEVFEEDDMSLVLDMIGKSPVMSKVGNTLYGLFDGYLYDDLMELMKTNTRIPSYELRPLKSLVERIEKNLDTVK